MAPSWCIPRMFLVLQKLEKPIPRIEIQVFPGNRCQNPLLFPLLVEFFKNHEYSWIYAILYSWTGSVQDSWNRDSILWTSSTFLPVLSRIPHLLWFTFQVKGSLIFFLAPAWFWTILVLVQNAPRGSKLGAWTWEEPVPCWWILKGYADKDWTQFSFMCKFTAWTSLLPFPSARGSALARSSTAASLQELQTVLLAWVCLQCSNAMMDVFKSPQTPKACLFNTLWWGCTSGRGQRDLADRSSSSAAGGSLQLTSKFAALEVKQALCFLTPIFFYIPHRCYCTSKPCGATVKCYTDVFIQVKSPQPFSFSFDYFGLVKPGCASV